MTSIKKETINAFANVGNGGSAVSTVTSPTFSHFTSAAKGDMHAKAQVKQGYSEGDYRYYREHERLPVTDRELMKYGDDAYYKVGIVRNIVDLMSDFVVKGIKWEHSNKNVEAFYNSWFREVSGLEVSERFCSYLLRMGNAVIHPIESKIEANTAKEWKKTRGEEFLNMDLVRRDKIVSHYTFLNPLTLSHLTKELGNFIGQRIYQVTVPSSVYNLCQSYSLGRNVHSKYSKYLSGLPKDLMNRISEGNGTLTFTDDELLVEHYRKDDWSDWAKPMISCIFPQLVMLEKMHLADMSALDGAISNIRLWKLGFIDPQNINNSYIPSPETLAQVRDLIHNNVSGGVLDLIWGPELDFKESNTQVHNFLGPEKYIQVMNEIYDGLGVPPSLSGGGGGGSTGGGFTNNFISMKVLVDRLDYLRQKLKKFWTKEAKKLQRAMGFSSPAKLSFDDAIVSDEGQQKKLLLDMWDRDLIDSETVLNQFNMYPKVVKSRIVKEMKQRQKHKVPQKASPYHNPMWVDQLQSDLVKVDKTDDDFLPFEVEEDDDGLEVGLNNDPKDTPKSQNGRPKFSKDQNKRKDKIVRPRTSAFINIQNWAKTAYAEIGEMITPIFVKSKNKQTARDLNLSETKELETFKLTVLNNIKPFTEINATIVGTVCSTMSSASLTIAIRDELIKEMSAKRDKKLSIEEKRSASVLAYALNNVK